jgi:hypothetical protein
VAALSTLPNAVDAATRVVDAGPTTIQAALSIADPGDTLLLSPGTYAIEGTIDVQKSVSFISLAGPEVTIIDKQKDFGSVFFVSPMLIGPTIMGLTIKGGVQIFTGSGAGIYCVNAHPTIVNNVIIGNAAGNLEGHNGAGAGVAIFGGSVNLTNNTIAGNTSGAGAVFLQQCSGTVSHNIIAYNNDGLDNFSDGYGIACLDASAVIDNNMYWSNLPAPWPPSCSIDSTVNVQMDPKFCEPRTGRQAGLGDWRVTADSPVAPGHAYAGWGAPVSVCGSTPAAVRSWGSLKSLYR